MLVAVRILLATIALGCATMVFSVQVQVAPWVMVVGLAVPAILAYLLHRLDPVIPEPSARYAVTPLSFSEFMGPYAAALIGPLSYTLLAANALWALRWLLGAHFVATGIYQLDANTTNTLLECGQAHPWVEGAQSCNVIAGFLANGWPVYVHCTGAVTCLVLGPFQLNGWFRSLKEKRLHRALGYAYVVATALGTVGAVALMAQTTSGIAAATGFLALVVAWNVSLAKGISYARAKNFEMHREWMIRNYTYTFTAVPFRFLPGMFVAMGAESNVAYPLATWLTVMLAVLFAEKFLELTREQQRSRNKATNSVEMGSALGASLT